MKAVKRVLKGNVTENLWTGETTTQENSASFSVPADELSLGIESSALDGGESVVLSGNENELSGDIIPIATISGDPDEAWIKTTDTELLPLQGGGESSIISVSINSEIVGSYSVSDGEIGEFEKPKLAINFSSKDNTKGTVTGENLVEVGEDVTLTAIPEEGFQLLYWKDDAGNIVSKDEEFTFTVDSETAAKEYTAHFIRNYTENEIHGAFTVNADGKMVAFAKGNLYANVVFGEGDQSAVAQSVTSYGIEAEQWHYRSWNNGVDTDKYEGDAAMLGATSSETPAGTIGLFSWTNNALEACSKVYADDDAAENDVFFASSITVNGQEMGCLTRSEIDYLLGSRPGNRFAKAIVNNVKGLLIFPDGWEDSGFDIKATNNGSVSYKSTKDKVTRETVYKVSLLSLETFAGLQAEGVVFLPAAGYRNNSTLEAGRDAGYYWSGTPYTGTFAICMYSYDFSLHPSDSFSRRVGQSVRPVFEL